VTRRGNDAGEQKSKIRVKREEIGKTEMASAGRKWFTRRGGKNELVKQRSVCKKKHICINFFYK